MAFYHSTEQMRQMVSYIDKIEQLKRTIKVLRSTISDAVQNTSDEDVKEKLLQTIRSNRLTFY
jgi:hypothetical protein